MNTPSHKRIPRSVLFTVLALAVVAGGIVLARGTIFHKKSVAVGGNSYTKGEASTPATDKSSGSSVQSSENSSNTQGNQQNIQTAGAGNTSSPATLLEPSGDFVSNHHPNLGGSPAPNTMSSVCTSTPGATCKISFTKDGVTKSLDSMSTDKGGSAFWNWKLQDIGLTSGTWNIRATASLNGQDKSSSDALDLVVEP